MARVIEDKKPATLDNVEGLVHFEVSVSRDTYANRDLLRSRSETVGAF
jgi:hypothetical protein